MKQPTPTTCKCRKKADYSFRELQEEFWKAPVTVTYDRIDESYHPNEKMNIGFGAWLYEKFQGKIVSIYFDQ